jgi:hypothetical protein
MKDLRFLLFVVLMFSSAARAQAQDPVPPRDTVRTRVDTAAVDTTARPDSTRAAPVVQDSVRPIPQLAKH